VSEESPNARFFGKRVLLSRTTVDTQMYASETKYQTTDHCAEGDCTAITDTHIGLGADDKRRWFRTAGENPWVPEVIVR